VGSPAGFAGQAWDWCRRVAARHRVLAVLAGTAAVFGIAMAAAMSYLLGTDLDSADRVKARESLGHIQRASGAALQAGLAVP
jgi:hypothetical protein